MSTPFSNFLVHNPLRSFNRDWKLALSFNRLHLESTYTQIKGQTNKIDYSVICRPQ